MVQVDLNCDMGESFGAYQMGNDEELFSSITSANIACGFHAGDPSTMHKTVKLAIQHGVGIGAHPGLPDLVGFGRREMQISSKEAYELMVYQMGALAAFIDAEGGKFQHVKPHGALYNMAAKNKALAEAIAEAVYHVNPNLVLFGLSGSEVIQAGKRLGLRTANEVFADRTYQQDGSLTPRNQAGAMITDEEMSVHQVIRMVKEGLVKSQQDVDIPIQADTICIHGDGAHAVAFAKKIRSQFEASAIKVCSFS